MTAKIIDPLKAYHGSRTVIERFDYRFTNAGTDQLGSGFYFTNQFDEARGYALRDKGSSEQKEVPGAFPNVAHVHLRLSNPMLADQITPYLTTASVRSLLSRSPCLDESLENFGDVSFQGKESVLNQAVATYVTRPGCSRPLVQRLFDVANDFFPEHVEQFNRAVFEVLGFDGVVKKFEDGQTHYVAFFPEQIEIVETEHIALEARQNDSVKQKNRLKAVRPG